METEMKPQAKKEWKTPELIILVQSKPEEAVLAACKVRASGAGPTTGVIGCNVAGSCQPCSIASTS